MSTAYLYAVPVLKGFDAIRNCSHCRRNTDDNCKAWREARGSVAVLTQEARRLAKGVDELRDATGGRTANIYQFAVRIGRVLCVGRAGLSGSGRAEGRRPDKGGANTQREWCAGERSARERRKHLSHKVNNAV